MNVRCVYFWTKSINSGAPREIINSRINFLDTAEDKNASRYKFWNQVLLLTRKDTLIIFMDQKSARNN